MAGEENPFIRFKNRVDNNVRRAFDSVVGALQVPPSSDSTASSTGSTGSTGSSYPDSSDTHTTGNHPSPHPSSSVSSPTSSSSSSSPLPLPLPSPLPSPASKMAPPSSSHTAPSTTGESEFESEQQQKQYPSTAITTPTTQATINAPSTMDDVHDWAVHSPYSPLNLQDLPQPTPRDVPAEEYGQLPFTYRDAFEELLIAGSGFPLRSGPELASRMTTTGAALSFPYQHYHPYSSEGQRGFHVAHWVDQLALLGLWDAYFNLEKQERWDAMMGSRPGSGFGASIRARTRTGSGLETAETDMDRMFFRLPPPSRYRVLFGERDDERVNEYVSQFPPMPRWESAGLWDFVWRLGLERDGRSGEWTSTASGRRRQDGHDNNRYRDDDGDDYDDDDDDDNGDEGREADIEDELYAPRHTSGATPPSRFHHHHHHHHHNDHHHLPPPSSVTKSSSGAGPEVTTRVFPDGSKTVTAIERRQKGGKTETATSVQHFGPDGVLVSESRETSTTRTWSGHVPGAQASMSWSFNSASRGSSSSSARALGDGEQDKNRDRGGDDDHDGNKGGDGKDGKNGWFWGR